MSVAVTVVFSMVRAMLVADSVPLEVKDVAVGVQPKSLGVMFGLLSTYEMSVMYGQPGKVPSELRMIPRASIARPEAAIAEGESEAPTPKEPVAPKIMD
jgi:hypothetical protein